MDLSNPKVSYYNQEDFIKILSGLNIEYHRKGKKGAEIADLITSFDIETTSLISRPSLHVEPIKDAIMYIWQYAIEDYVFIGRTYKELVDMFSTMSKYLGLSKNKHVVVWVHNFAFEWQWIKKVFKWQDDCIVATTDRRIIKNVTEDGLEFKCSYMLSGMSLADLSSNGIKQGIVQKMVGDLDYDLIRTPITSLTEKELKYCYNDTLVVVEYIKEQLMIYKHMCFIPNTKTGAVRNFIKNETLYNKDKAIANNYKNLMKRLTIEPDELKIAIKAFAGGFTHASNQYSGQIVEGLLSLDESSAYPAVMTQEMYPMSKGVYIDFTDMDEWQDKYLELDKHGLMIFTIYLYNVRAITKTEHIISKSKCLQTKKAEWDNGRLVKADFIAMTITSVDLESIVDFYSWDNELIEGVWYYKRSYLPTCLLEAILSLYVDKTTLKGIEGKELEYNLKKSNLNSTYGMMVMSILTKEVYYDEVTGLTQYRNNRSIEEVLDEYNNNQGRFLYYIWGVFVTAYARQRIFKVIKRVGNNYVYTDTDSVKFIMEGIESEQVQAEFNLEIDKAIDRVCNSRGIPKDMYYPVDKNMKAHPLGYLEVDDVYDKFKTLGAKRYAYYHTIKGEKKFGVTCAGVNKKKAASYISMQNEPLEFFSDGMVIPKEYAGRMISCYIDTTRILKGVEDYQGNVMDEIVCPSGVNLMPTSFELSVSDEYANYLDNAEYINTMLMEIYYNETIDY